MGAVNLHPGRVRAVAEAENGFTVLMGDSLDCARTHYRDHIRGYRQDENSQQALDEWIKRDVEALARQGRTPQAPPDCIQCEKPMKPYPPYWMCPRCGYVKRTPTTQACEA